MRFIRALSLTSVVLGPASSIAQDIEAVEPPVLTPGDNQAVVYFLKPAQFVGSGVKFWVYVDETPIGMVRAGDYTGAVVPAGERLLWAKAGEIIANRHTLDAGKTYFFKMEIRMRVRFELLAEADAEAAIAELDYTTLTDEGRERSAEILADDFEEAIEVADEAAEDASEESASDSAAATER